MKLFLSVRGDNSVDKENDFVGAIDSKRTTMRERVDAILFMVEYFGC